MSFSLQSGSSLMEGNGMKTSQRANTTGIQTIAGICFFIASIMVAQPARGQGTIVSTPGTRVSDSFFERTGVNFGFSLPSGGAGQGGSRIVGFGPNGIQPNITFSQGSFGATQPPIGGFNPNTATRFGFGLQTPGGGGFSLGFELSKGSTRSLGTAAPSVNVLNGQSGRFFNGNNRPFVTSVTPITGIGNYSTPLDNAVTRAVNSGRLDLSGNSYEQRAEERRRARPAPAIPVASTAATSDISVEAIKAQRAAQQNAQNAAIEQLIEQSRAYEAEEDFYNARKCLRKAASLTDDRNMQEYLRSLKLQVGKSKPDQR